MILRHRVALDGVQLDSADDRIMITRVETGDGKTNIQTVSLWGDGVGSRVTSMHRDSLDINVRFRIRLKKRNMSEREEVLEKVNAWAMAGGWLTCGFRENRRIRVFLAAPAGSGDPWEWTREYTLVFRACGVPWWQEELPTITRKTDFTGGSVVIGCNGSFGSVLDVAFLNTGSGTVNTFEIQTGESGMVFSSLGLGVGETLEIDHDDNGKRCLLRIRIKGTNGGYRSAMSKRSGGSSDDLHVSPGLRTLTVTPGGTGRLTVSNYGRFS